MSVGRYEQKSFTCATVNIIGGPYLHTAVQGEIPFMLPYGGPAHSLCIK